jgi:hypothetical protein
MLNLMVANQLRVQQPGMLPESAPEPEPQQ